MTTEEYVVKTLKLIRIIPKCFEYLSDSPTFKHHSMRYLERSGHLRTLFPGGTA